MRYIPVIPSNSLFLIEERWGGKIDPYIYLLRGRHRVSEASRKEALSPFTSLTITPQHFTFIVDYDRRRHDPLPIAELVGSIMERGGHDLWIDKLALFFSDRRGPFSEFSVHFENVAAPPGSLVEAQAKAMRRRYMKRNNIPITPETMRFRLLRFSIALSPSRNPIDPFELENAKFRSVLTERTFGLVTLMEEKEVGRTVFKGVRLCPIPESPWSRELEE